MNKRRYISQNIISVDLLPQDVMVANNLVHVKKESGNFMKNKLLIDDALVLGSVAAAARLRMSVIGEPCCL